VSADLDVAGGSVTATGADGTVFTLELPPQALLAPETVTLTPVLRLDHFPFSGGLVAGVEIEPEGLDLMVPATLTIRPVSSPPVDRTLPYSYGRGGEDFILYPRDVDPLSLRLPLVRFAGYGAGQGDPTEAASQVERMPTGPLAPYLQRYAHEVFLRVRGVISQAELADRGIQIYKDAVDELLGPLLPPASGSAPEPVFQRKEERCRLGDGDFRTGLESVVAITKQKQMLGADSEDPAESILHIFVEGLQVCIQEAFDRCVSRNDPYEVLLILQFSRQLQLLGEEDPLLTSYTEGSFVERCLRFELDFESKVVSQYTFQGLTSTTRLKYRARHVPLRFSYGGNDYANRSIWEGACSLLPEVAELDLPVETPECHVTIVPGNGWFTAAAAWIDVMEDPTRSAVNLLYHPGAPTVKATLICNDGDPVDFPVFQFAADYHILHGNESSWGSGLYWASKWDQLRYGPGPSQNGEFFAKKSYERTIPDQETMLTEETWFFLKHTPDAPMPDCP
jgi:hypothetical protein